METLKPGMILHSSWGYDMTLNNFYVVRRVSAASAWVQEVAAVVKNDNGMGDGTAEPDPGCVAWVWNNDGQRVEAPVKRFKIQRYGNSSAESLWDSRKQRSMTIWSGRPVYHNTYD